MSTAFATAQPKTITMGAEVFFGNVLILIYEFCGMPQLSDVNLWMDKVLVFSTGGNTEALYVTDVSAMRYFLEVLTVIVTVTQKCNKSCNTIM
jgi:hypothetical protein